MRKGSKKEETKQGLFIRMFLGVPLSLEIRMLPSWGQRGHISQESFRVCFRKERVGEEESE